MAATRRLVLLILLTFAALGQAEDHGNDGREAQVRREIIHKTASMRNFTFRSINSVYTSLSFAHLYSFINYSQAIEKFNTFTYIYDNELEKIHPVLNSLNISDFNATFTMLSAKLQSAFDFLNFISFTLDCPIEVSQSKFQFELRSPPSLSDFMYIDPLDWKRPKRQAFLGGMAFATLGLGLVSLFNGPELLHLKSQLSQEKHNMNLVVARLRETDSIISRQAQRIFTIRRAVNKLIEASEYNEARILVNELIAHLSLSLDEIVYYSESLVSILQNKRVHPRFFTSTSMSNAFKQVKMSAEKHNLVPANKKASEVIFEPLSYHIEKGTIFLAIHLALHAEQEYKLFQYVNSPLLFPDGTAMQLSSSFPTLLAVHDAENFVLSEDDRRRCLPKDKGLICPPVAIRRSLKTTCLGSLYLGSFEALQLHCKFESLDPYTEILSVMDGQSIVVFAPPHAQVPAYVTCPLSNMSRQLIIRNYETLHLGDNCDILFPHFIFRANSQLKINGTFISRKLVDFTEEGFRAIVKSTPSQISPFSKLTFQTPLNTISNSSENEFAPWLQITVIILLTLGVFVLGTALLMQRLRGKRPDRQRGGRLPRQGESDVGVVEKPREWPNRHNGEDGHQHLLLHVADKLEPHPQPARRWWHFFKRREVDTGRKEGKASVALPPSLILPTTPEEKDEGEATVE